MRIAQMIDQIKVGGAETLQLTFAREMQGRDVELTVIGLTEKNPTMRAAITETGAQVHVFGGKTLADPRRFFKLFRFIRAGKFDILHTNLCYSNILGVIIARMLGIPVVASLHNEQMSKGARGRLEKRVVRWGADRVIAVGNRIAEIHREWLRNKPIQVVSNAVPAIPSLTAEERATVRREFIAEGENITLLISVGRFFESKGYPDLVRAFQHVNKQRPDTRLIIVGHGTLYDEISTLVDTLDLRHCIYLTGLRYDVPRLLAAADIYVNASWWEGLPVTVLEAMSAGLPVVVTSVGETPHVVIENTGILVPPHQPEQLANALITLLTDPRRWREMGANAREHANTHYSSRTWANQLIDLYQNMLTRNMSGKTLTESNS